MLDFFHWNLIGGKYNALTRLIWEYKILLNPFINVLLYYWTKEWMKEWMSVYAWVCVCVSVIQLIWVFWKATGKLVWCLQGRNTSMKFLSPYKRTEVNSKHTWAQCFQWPRLFERHFLELKISSHLCTPDTTSLY